MTNRKNNIKKRKNLPGKQKDLNPGKNLQKMKLNNRLLPKEAVPLR